MNKKTLINTHYANDLKQSLVTRRTRGMGEKKGGRGGGKGGLSVFLTLISGPFVLLTPPRCFKSSAAQRWNT